MGRKIEAFKNYVIISRSRAVIVVNILNEDVKVLKVPNNNKAEADAVQKCNIENTYIAVSPNNEYLAAANDDKQMIIWDTSNWVVHKSQMLLRKPMAVTFSHDSSKILVADKTGDVYHFPLTGIDAAASGSWQFVHHSDLEYGPEPLLGHLSMLLDMIVSSEGQFLITCDRDEKIRVSSYPNSYNIHAFCLGHEEFVYHVQQLPGENNFILSSSGDGTVRLWDLKSGDCFAVLDTGTEVERFHRTLKITGQNDITKSVVAITKLDILQTNAKEYILVLQMHRLPLLLFYKIVDCCFHYLSTYEMPLPPSDIKFLSNGELLVLREIPKDYIEIPSLNPILVLNPSFHDNNLIVTEPSSHPLLNFGKNYKDVFGADVCCPPDVESLYKQRYDNVAEYQRRKEERISSTTQTKKGKFS